MYCFWNHGECLLPLLSVLSWRSCTTQTIERFVLVKAQNQNKMHTNVSLLLIYNHWWTLLVLMERKKKIYMRVDSNTRPLKCLIEVLPRDYQRTWGKRANLCIYSLLWRISALIILYYQYFYVYKHSHFRRLHCLLLPLTRDIRFWPYCPSKSFITHYQQARHVGYTSCISFGHHKVSLWPRILPLAYSGSIAIPEVKHTLLITLRT